MYSCFHYCVVSHFCILGSTNSKHVWIIGDQHVVNIERVSKSRPGGLGLDQFGVKVTYLCRDGILLNDISDMITEGKEKFHCCPDLAIIHIGANDVKFKELYSVAKENISKMLDRCQELLPTTSSVLFSELFPHFNCIEMNGACEHPTPHFNRHNRNANTQLIARVNACAKEDWQMIFHRYINHKEKDFFADCITLTDQGYSLVLDMFVNKVKHFFTHFPAPTS